MYVSRLVCALGLCCVLLGACVATVREVPQSYTVRAQDTLYSIAWRHDLDYRDLARWNNIGPDFRIAVGQVLMLGPREESGHERRAPAVLPGGTSRPRATDTQRPGTARPAPESQVPIPSNIARAWVWPTEHTSAPRPAPSGGIFLAGHVGQDVRAAYAGRVVYAGSGLRGYGNLIIIKHAESLLSAYAHNREMLVHEGQEVATGQVIAHMGQDARQSPVLYFEIRQNGKPIDSIAFLTKTK